MPLSDLWGKFGLVLRVETVINSPREFRVRRKRTRNGEPTTVWCPMNKGVTNLPSYQRVCRAANDRYLNALSVVNDPTPAYQQVADLTESKTSRGRRYAGFNPARKDDVRLFQAVLSGAHELRGFHNSDIRESLHDPTTLPRTPACCIKSCARRAIIKQRKTLNRQLFSKDDPMAVRSDDCELAHAPGFVRKLVPDFDSILHDLIVQLCCILNMKIRKPGVVLSI